MKTATIWSRLADVAGLVATPLAPSHYLALVAPHRRMARVEAVYDETPGVRTLILRPGFGWRSHRAGQHVRVEVSVDGRLTTRCYSISSAEHDRRIAITVKAQGRVSNVLARDVKPGTYLALGMPEGDFVLPDDPGRPLFITAGSGITPIASMLRTLAARGDLPDIAHVHYERGEMIFGDELRALAVAHPRYRLIIVHADRRFSTAQLDELVPDWRTREAWACGPAGLLAAIETCFAGADRTRALHVERFTPPIANVPADAHGGRVRFIASGAITNADARTPLLQVAETAGVNAPHGCRMGICHSCDATLVAGCVRDLRTGDLVEPGARVQICVCAAAGDVDLAL